MANDPTLTPVPAPTGPDQVVPAPTGPNPDSTVQIDPSLVAARPDSAVTPPVPHPVLSRIQTVLAGVPDKVRDAYAGSLDKLLDVLVSSTDPQYVNVPPDMKQKMQADLRGQSAQALGALGIPVRAKGESEPKMYQGALPLPGEGEEPIPVSPMESEFSKLGAKKVSEPTKPSNPVVMNDAIMGTTGKMIAPAPQDNRAPAVLDRISDSYGTHTNPAKTREGATFIHPDGSFTSLPAGQDHPQVIKEHGYSAGSNDDRVGFINESGAVRTNFRKGRQGNILAVSVPNDGVTPEQVDSIKQAVGQGLGRNGNLVIETADSPTNVRNKVIEFAKPADVEPALREIGSHPDQAVSANAETSAAGETDALTPTIAASQAVGGKKKNPETPAENEISPNSKLQASAQKYAKAKGMPEINHAPVQADPQRAREIANIYDQAEHAPNDPRVKAAYDALKSETKDQFNHLRASGLKFEPQAEDPYTSAGEMMNDIKQNNRLKVFTGGADLPKDHPLAAIDPETGETYNTLFRWVHDAMGHAAGGNDFSENGEKSATEAHAQMYSDLARPAMRNETEGQTSWFFHNPDVESGVKQPGDFAAQKANILPDTSANWHKTAGTMASTNEAGGINPRTGKSDTAGFGTELAPEFRLPLDHAPTPGDFKNFYDAHRDIFDKHPELRVGWDNNSAVPGGHEINVGAVGPNAAAVARKLDQQSAFDIAKGEIIPTGGKGLQTSFPKYPIEDRIKELNEKTPNGNISASQQAATPESSRTVTSPTVSTRVPTKMSKGAVVENHADQSLTSDMEAAKAAPGYVQKMANRIQNVPGVKYPEGGDAQTQADTYIRHVADNVKFVQGKLTPAEIARDEQWYPVGAHERVLDVAKQHGFTPTQVAGVTAVESPMTDWDVNTALAERTANIWKNQQDTEFTPEMQKAANKITSLPANKSFKKAFKPIIGKTLGELTNTTDQALWLRLYDEAHNPREYQTWNPDGTSGGLAKNRDGSPKQVGWSFQRHIEKAIDILKDGSPENISKQLGYGHKVRNFYNNMIAPDDPRYLTIDTHAVNVGQLRPMPGKAPSVKNNFGGIKNGAYGLKGTYPLNDAGYRLAAKELDIAVPSRLQSPVWTKIREVFNDNFKTQENLDAVDAIWKEHTDGKITADQARQRVWDYATRWNADAAGKNGTPSDQGELFEGSLPGESSSGTPGRGTGSGTTGGASETVVNPNEGDTSFNFGANAPVKTPKKPAKGSALNFLDAINRLKKPAK